MRTPSWALVAHVGVLCSWETVARAQQSTRTIGDCPNELNNSRGLDNVFLQTEYKRRRNTTVVTEKRERNEVNPGPAGVDQAIHDLWQKLLGFPQQVIDAFHKTVQNVKSAGSFTAELRREAEYMHRKFLPGFTLSNKVARGTGYCCAFAIAWFFFFIRYIYRSDRAWIENPWGTSPSPEEHPGFSPDLVLVFPNPASQSRWSSRQVSSGLLERVLSHNRPKSAADPLPRLAAQIGGESTFEMAGAALLQDLYTLLPSRGFQVSVFSSVDDNELLLCVSLRHDEAIQHHLLRNDAELDLQLEIAEALGISQPPSEPESSPPLFRFDPAIVAELHRSAVLKSADPKEMYRTYHGVGEHGLLVSGTDRIRIIFRELTTCLDLDAAVSYGLLLDWYPVHSERRLTLLRDTWANFRLVGDMTSSQPIHILKEYFGSRTAYTQAWAGTYSRALLALVPVALIWIILGIIAAMSQSRAHLSPQMFGFSFILVAWAFLAWNLWEREASFLIEQWNSSEEGAVIGGHLVRPQFRGTIGPSPVDGNMTEVQFPASSTVFRATITGLITLMCCAVVASCIFSWVSLFEGNLNLVASLVLTIQMKTLEFLYNSIVQLLVEWENHKQMGTYYDSWLWKQFVFRAFNSYYAFIYLVLFRGHTHSGCPDGDCLSLLRKQLAATLTMLTLARIAEVLMSVAKAMFRLWLERHGREVQISFTEEQASWTQVSTKEQIDGMLQLVISLGYVMLFGCAVPSVVPLCFVSFLLQLRCNAFRLTTMTKRPFPWHSVGVGAWKTVVKRLMWSGVMVNAILLVAYGSAFTDAKLITKLTATLLFFLSASILSSVISYFVPPQDPAASLLRARRHHVLRVLAQKAEEGAAGNRLPDLGRLATKAELSQLVEAGDWQAIPRFDGSSQGLESPHQK